MWGGGVPEVGAGQALPLSKMMAATVPLQARYGEVCSTRRSKPALTTAAQRCSWVRMFSAGWGESGGGDPTDSTFPLTTGLGTMGVHLPTLRGATGGLLGSFGGSGRKTGGGLLWVPGPARLSFILLEAKKFHWWECEGRSCSSSPKFLGSPSSSPCTPRVGRLQRN